ncbi:MAG: twin-arginine translocation signal domain-containing protein, partial [Planctomycetota bacterium]
MTWKQTLRPELTPREAAVQFQTRRHFLQRSPIGLGAVAAALMQAGATRPVSADDQQSAQTVRRPTAKNVIYLHMAGSPSQLELFD